MSVVLVTRHWGGLGLALLMQRQGSDVVCAYDYGGLDGKELAATEQIGDLLVSKMPLEKALRERTDPDTLWVFDSNDVPDAADHLREQGRLVIGTSRLAKRLEDDRDFAGEIAEHVGFTLPETEEFTDYQAGAEFLEAHPDRAFVFKPDKQDPTMTYVPLSGDDPAQANEEVRRYLESLTGTHSPKFVLQEQIRGVELNLELWVSHGQALCALCDLEAKRRLTGDLGAMCGCAGDYVYVVPVEHPLVKATVGRYLTWPALADYTGSVDANIMLAEGQAYFLENCFRFGYNAYPTIFQSLALAPMETMLRAWVAGDASVAGMFDSGIAGSLTLTLDHPQTGTPLLVPEHLNDQVYLYRAYQAEDGVQLVDQWSEVACVTALGTSIAEAGSACLDAMEQLGTPNKGYRTDLAGETPETVPGARYQALTAWNLRAGLVPQTVDA